MSSPSTARTPPRPDRDRYLTDDGRTPSTDDYDEASSSSNNQKDLSVALSGEEELGLLVESYSGSGYYTLAVEERGE